jgi:hypothetical protein
VPDGSGLAWPPLSEYATPLGLFPLACLGEYQIPNLMMKQGSASAGWQWIGLATTQQKTTTQPEIMEIDLEKRLKSERVNRTIYHLLHATSVSCGMR